MFLFVWLRPVTSYMVHVYDTSPIYACGLFGIYGVHAQFGWHIVSGIYAAITCHVEDIVGCVFGIHMQKCLVHMPL